MSFRTPGGNVSPWNSICRRRQSSELLSRNDSRPLFHFPNLRVGGLVSAGPVLAKDCLPRCHSFWSNLRVTPGIQPCLIDATNVANAYLQDFGQCTGNEAGT